jgi:predicted phosphodiesterase
VRIAALHDIHGNLAALDAVLREAVSSDAIVVGGDVASGPQPVQVLDRLAALGDRARWVRGNADRELLDPPHADDEARRAARFAAALLEPHHRALIARFEPTVTLDGVLFCHGTPRSDTEIVTRLTPEERLDALAGNARLVVGRAHDIDPDKIRATGFPDAEAWLRESFLDPAAPDHVARLFEARNRGSDCKRPSE